MSCSFSAKAGSVESLNPSVRCGLRSNAFQIRPIVDLLSPTRWAIFARLQCVAFAGHVGARFKQAAGVYQVLGAIHGKRRRDAPVLEVPGRELARVRVALERSAGRAARPGDAPVTGIAVEYGFQASTTVKAAPIPGSVVF